MAGRVECGQTRPDLTLPDKFSWPVIALFLSPLCRKTIFFMYGNVRSCCIYSTRAAAGILFTAGDYEIRGTTPKPRETCETPFPFPSYPIPRRL